MFIPVDGVPFVFGVLIYGDWSIDDAEDVLGDKFSATEFTGVELLFFIPLRPLRKRWVTGVVSIILNYIFHIWASMTVLIWILKKFKCIMRNMFYTNSYHTVLLEKHWFVYLLRAKLHRVLCNWWDTDVPNFNMFIKTQLNLRAEHLNFQVLVNNKITFWYT